MKVVLRGKEVDMEIEFIEVKARGLAFGKESRCLRIPVIHRGSGCFGYVFQEKTKRPFLVEQAEALGVPVDPNANASSPGESITLADGRSVKPKRCSANRSRDEIGLRRRHCAHGRSDGTRAQRGRGW